jgi:RNA polymerase sigma-70 factor (ECF subfamily)
MVAPPRRPAQPDAEALRAALQEARGQWPQIRVDEERFSKHLRSRGAPLAGLHLDQLLLAWACAEGEAAALRALEEDILSEVPRWVSRVAGVQADDVHQLVCERLLVLRPPQILEYAGRGTLKAFVRIAAIRCAIDLQRQQKAKAGPQPLDPLIDTPDPEIDFLKLHDRAALRAVLREALQGLPSRDSTLLRLHYLEGCSLERLAAVQNAGRATVARWLQQARKRVLERVRDLLRERLRLSEREQQSLLRLVDSKLELSLRSALAG